MTSRHPAPAGSHTGSPSSIVLVPPGSRRPGAVDLAAAALRLRDWALEVLASRDDPQPSPVASPEAWEVFLRTERCALPLVGRAGRGGAHEVLRRLATEEMTRVLSARAQLRVLDRIAAAGGWAPILLKGGVSAAGEDPLDLMDLDVLLVRDQAPRFAEAMGREGYGSLEPDVIGPDSSAHHLGNRRLPGSIQVEVHFRLPLVDDDARVRARSLPLAGADSFRRLGAADHAWHLLLHAAVQHPFRRGRIRDLLLIARALAECAPDERAEVHARVAAHPFAGPLEAVARAAEALGRGTLPPDTFRTIAAGNYVSHGWPKRWLLGRSADVTEVLFTLIGSPEDRREFAGRVWWNPPRASEVAVVARMERRSPPLGAAARRAVRVARFGAAALGALPLAVSALAARRRAERP
jgi:hypothetical protein